MANLGYVRVSATEQNNARQREALEKFNIDKWFEEKVSGKDANRKKLQAMLDYCHEGDTIYVNDFSRLARNIKDLLDIAEIKTIGLIQRYDMRRQRNMLKTA